jgi:hypothetical protein
MIAFGWNIPQRFAVLPLYCRCDTVTAAGLFPSLTTYCTPYHTTMDSLLHRQTVSQIQQLKDNYASRRIDDWAYIVGRARILDHYIHVSDHQANPSLTTTRLQRLDSFLPFLGRQEISVEWQRMCRQDQHPFQQCPVPLLPRPLGPLSFQQEFVRSQPIFPQYPVPLLLAPPPPPFPRVFGRGYLEQEFVQPPQVLPAAGRKKPYQVIYPGTGMLLNEAKAFLEECFLPFQMKSKGGGQCGQLMFCCRRRDCTLVRRLVPVLHSDPPLYIAEVNRNFGQHTNHTVNELEEAQQMVLQPVLGPSGKSSGFTPLSFAVKHYIDELVSDTPNITAEKIMERLVDHIRFYDLPFLTDHHRRLDTTMKVRVYRSNATRSLIVRNPVDSIADLGDWVKSRQLVVPEAFTMPVPPTTWLNFESFFKQYELAYNSELPTSPALQVPMAPKKRISGFVW